MSNNIAFDWDQYETLQAAPSIDDTLPQPIEQAVVPSPEEETQEPFDWEKPEYDIEPKESKFKSALRTVYQPMIGALSFLPLPLLLSGVDAIIGMTADSLIKNVRENLEKHKKEYPELDWENIDDEAYIQEAVKNLEATKKAWPTLQKGASYLEKKFDVPLEAQTYEQELLRFGGGIGSMAEGLANKAIAFTTSMASKSALDTVAPDASELAKELISGGVGLTAGKGFAKVAEKGAEILERRPTPEKLVEKTVEARPISPSGPPPPPPPGAPTTTGFQVAEEALEELAAGETATIEKGLAEEALAKAKGERLRPKPLPSGRELPSLRGRVTEAGEDIGIRPAPSRPDPANLKQNVANSVYPSEIYNKTRTGIGYKDQITSIAEERLNPISELYNEYNSRVEGLSTVHAEMVHNLNEKAIRLRKISQRSSVQEQLLGGIEAILEDTAVIVDGRVTGLRPYELTTLSDQIQSFNYMVSHDFIRGDPKNIFLPIIEDLKNGLESATIRLGEQEAADILRSANTQYRGWKGTYDTPYIKQFRDPANEDFSGLYSGVEKSSDNFNKVRRIVDATPEGRELLGATQREITKKALDKFTKDPRNIPAGELQREFRELETILTPEQLSAVREDFQTAQRRFPEKVRQVKMPEKISNDVQAIRKYLDLEPEAIEKMGKSVSGIRKLRKALSTTERRKEIFDKFAERRVRDILSGDQVKPRYSGKDLYEVMNKKKNYELISELTSPKTAQETLEIAEQIGDRRITIENVKKYTGKVIGKALHYRIIRWILKPIPIL